MRLDAEQRFSGKADIAFGRFFQPRQHAQRRGLAAAGRAHEGQEFAFMDFEVHALHRFEFVEALHDIVEDDERA